MEKGRALFKEFEVDHISWLLAAASTLLDQQKTDRAIVLLEFLVLIDPHNVQGQTMLAYALLRQDDQRRCGTTLARLNQHQLSARERAAVDALSARLADNVPSGQPRLQGA